MTRRYCFIVIPTAILVIAWLLGVLRNRGSVVIEDYTIRQARDLVSPELLGQVSQLTERELEVAGDLWAVEMQGQQLDRLLESIWNELKASEEKLTLLARQSLGQLVLGSWNRSRDLLPANIETWHSDGGGKMIGPTEWEPFVDHFKEQGWVLDFLELRHTRFAPGGGMDPSKSHVEGVFALENSNESMRAIIKGPVSIEWKIDSPEEGRPIILSVDCRNLEMRVSLGEPPFHLLLEAAIEPPENAYAIDPLLVSDLDRDGRAEVILAAKNLLFRSDAEGQFRPEPLCAFPPGLISTALLADIDLDGADDLICMKHEGMVVLPGSPQGIFDQSEKVLWNRTKELKYPMVISGGDFDRDGDIDLFLGQYRVPYESGSLPTPYFDANDGYPFYVFRNDGDLDFVDVTDAIGLSKKRHRRVYSASFVDIDGKNGPDLIVVSDFAGADLYLNDGTGKFSEATQAVLGDTLGFGMAHAFADFNMDGKLDFVMAGMRSPTVARLQSLGIWRAGLTEDRTIRERMTHGTRVFLSTDSGRFAQGSAGEAVRQSGWSWGSSAADFNNDGYADLFIGNGLESRDSVRDYEPEYWLHDAFVAVSEPDPVAYMYFKEKFERTRGRGHSYGGYEYDRLYLNQGGESFLEAGYILGVGAQRDSRNVVTEDLNGDGRMDLLVTSFEHWPGANQTLRIFINQFESVGNWIGFDIDAEAGYPTPPGAQVLVRHENQTWVNEIVTGDSYRSQHSRRIHFGLGRVTGPVTAIIRWPDGTQETLGRLQVDRYYRVIRSGAGRVRVIGTE